MGVTGIESCFFIVWTPIEIKINKICFDKEFWEDMILSSLKDFLCLLPELCMRNLDQSLNNLSFQKLYCICNKPEEGKMIACDKDGCPITWFYFKCVNITRKPKGTWYCPNCQ